MGPRDFGASHARAVGVFRKARWNFVPYPVDYFTDGSGSFQPGFRPLGGMVSMNRAGREWIGLIAYRILGRIDELFPAPRKIADN